jgi:hypothetical protein
MGYGACGEHGVCIVASGTCDCFQGFTGRSCNVCDKGYAKLGDSCVFLGTEHRVKDSITQEAYFSAEVSYAEAIEEQIKPVGPSTAVSTASGEATQLRTNTLMVSALAAFDL